MRYHCLLLAMTVLTGCTGQTPIRTSMSADPVPSPQTEKALINTLTEAFSGSGQDIAFRDRPTDHDIRRYMAAGFTLTDIYCDNFFRETNAAKRRRQFARGAINDVGTAIGGILGLVSGVPRGVVSGTSLVTGSLDKTWRNYDESFVVAPELQNVRALVLAAQDDFRKTTFAAKMPDDYMTARSSIVRYAGLCTFLGMQSLLTQSVDQQRRLLSPAPTPTPTPGASPTPVEPAARLNAVPVG